MLLLLERDPAKRIGGFKDDSLLEDSPDLDMDKDDADDIRHHPFFNGVDWKALRTRSHPAPFKPKVADDLDLQCIDMVFLKEDLKETYENPSILSDAHVQGFSYRKEDNILK